VFRNQDLHLLLLDSFCFSVVRKFSISLSQIIIFIDYLVIFSLIGVSIFGGEVFPNSITVNWGYIVAVFAMVLFLIAGILFILDGIHSEKQISSVLRNKINFFSL